MPRNISKIELEKFALFSICSKKFGYGHYNRIQNLILILKDKNKKFIHYSYGEKFKNKNQFLEKLKYEISLGNNPIHDITNDFFLNHNTNLKLIILINVTKPNSIITSVKKIIPTLVDIIIVSVAVFMFLTSLAVTLDT